MNEIITVQEAAKKVVSLAEQLKAALDVLGTAAEKAEEENVALADRLRRVKEALE